MCGEEMKNKSVHVQPEMGGKKTRPLTITVHRPKLFLNRDMFVQHVIGAFTGVQIGFVVKQQPKNSPQQTKHVKHNAKHCQSLVLFVFRVVAIDTVIRRQIMLVLPVVFYFNTLEENEHFSRHTRVQRIHDHEQQRVQSCSGTFSGVHHTLVSFSTQTHRAVGDKGTTKDNGKQEKGKEKVWVKPRSQITSRAAKDRKQIDRKEFQKFACGVGALGREPHE